MDHCVIHIDGGARGNPGPAGAGVVIADADGTPVHEAGYFLGRATNNVAEYQGLLRALEQAAAIGARQVTLRSDSQLLVRQLTGEYRVKSTDLRPLFERAQSLLRRFGRWSIEHVPRAENARADALANQAMDAQADVVEFDGGAFGSGGGARAQAGGKADARGGGGGERGGAVTAGWTLTLIAGGEACPAGQPLDRPFHFGPRTPAGCCVHAAAAAMCDASAEPSEREVRCRQCAGRLRVVRKPA